MIFAVTGGGRTASGALRVLKLLPVKEIECDDVPALIDDKSNPEHRNWIYLVNIRSENVIVPRDETAKFDKVDYYTNPKKYKVLAWLSRTFSAPSIYPTSPACSTASTGRRSTLDT